MLISCPQPSLSWLELGELYFPGAVQVYTNTVNCYLYEWFIDRWDELNSSPVSSRSNGALYLEYTHVAAHYWVDVIDGARVWQWRTAAGGASGRRGAPQDDPPRVPAWNVGTELHGHLADLKQDHRMWPSLVRTHLLFSWSIQSVKILDVQNNVIN